MTVYDHTNDDRDQLRAELVVMASRCIRRYGDGEDDTEFSAGQFINRLLPWIEERLGVAERRATQAEAGRAQANDIAAEWQVRLVKERNRAEAAEAKLAAITELCDQAEANRSPIPDGHMMPAVLDVSSVRAVL